MRDYSCASSGLLVPPAALKYAVASHPPVVLRTFVTPPHPKS